MAYQVDKFNGTFLTSVEDGTIDTTTDLRFVGKNYAGYGEVQNENFLHLLENFSNTTPPPKVIEGQVWYDNANKKLKFYDGSKFKTATGAEVSSTAPSGLGTGELWWDTSAKQLYSWSGTEFVLVGPESSPDLGASGVTAQVVKDTGNTNHSILKFQAGGKVVGIVSQTAFTLNSTVNPIEGFSLIKKGWTLVDTNSVGVTANDFVYWGNASNALNLGGIAADQFLQKGSISFTEEIKFPDAGVKIGDQNDIRIRVENDDEIVFESVLGNPMQFIVTEDGLTRRNVYNVNIQGVDPGVNNTYRLGTAGLAWQSVTASTFNGNLTGNVTGNTTGSHTGNLLATDTQIMVNATSKEIGYPSATLKGTLFGSVQGNLTGTASNASALNSIQPDVNIPVSGTSIPIRDASGNIYANNFIGVGSKADRIKIDNTATDTDPDYKSAKTTASANTIAARDSAGDITANLFKGTATAARYADLAEKYLCDKEYSVGTVVAVGGALEVTATKEGDRAIGVVSAQPAFMMNSHQEGGTYIALKGRVPVKVVGRVSKGDKLVATNDGSAKRSNSSPDVFAIALEASEDTSVKLIEAVVL
jgi:hypothetical protein